MWLIFYVHLITALHASRTTSSTSSHFSMFADRPVLTTIEDVDEAEGEEALELRFDPMLNCYFDPKTNKYYELA